MMGRGSRCTRTWWQTRGSNSAAEREYSHETSTRVLNSKSHSRRHHQLVASTAHDDCLHRPTAACSLDTRYTWCRVNRIGAAGRGSRMKGLQLHALGRCAIVEIGR